jgi:hypothetical protein
VIARRRDIGRRRPPIGGSIVNLVRAGVAAAPANAAYRANLAIQHGGRQCASRCGQGRKALPTIARRIVFVHFVCRRPAFNEPADDIELAV